MRRAFIYGGFLAFVATTATWAGDWLGDVGSPRSRVPMHRAPSSHAMEWPRSSPPVRTLVPPCDREGESSIEPRVKRPYSYGFFGATGGTTVGKHTRWHHQTRTWTYR